jgi:hypothetical protein
MFASMVPTTALLTQMAPTSPSESLLRSRQTIAEAKGVDVCFSHTSIDHDPAAGLASRDEAEGITDRCDDPFTVTADMAFGPGTPRVGDPMCVRSRLFAVES